MSMADRVPRLGSTRRFFIALTLGGMFALAGVGCGGSGGGSTTSNSIVAPTTTTRSRVQSLHQQSLRNLSQSGYQNSTMAVGRYGGYGNGGGSTGGGYGAPVPVALPTEGDMGSGTGTATGSTAPTAGVPLIGSFLRNVAALPPQSRAAHLHAFKTRQEIAPGEPAPLPPDQMPPQPIENPSFYFDYYLGLWVAVTDTDLKTTYTLYEDEAKTKPAGNITTTHPANYDTFPQSYESDYSLTAGFLSGSHGHSKNITNADYSGSSEYDDAYADGWKDSGKSSWDARGNSSWSSRTETADGKWVESSGGFRSTGGGGTRTTTSEGYQADYTFNSDGSGHGRISGNDPGLPVTVSWDAYGNTTIQYADGTTEQLPGWGGYYGGGGYAVPATDTTAPSLEPVATPLPAKQ